MHLRNYYHQPKNLQVILDSFSRDHTHSTLVLSVLLPNAATVSNMGLNCVGALTHGFYSTNSINAFSLSYVFLNDIFFPLAYFIIKVLYVTHTACVNQLSYAISKASGQQLAISR